MSIAVAKGRGRLGGQQVPCGNDRKKGKCNGKYKCRFLRNDNTKTKVAAEW